jgi:hypothetical protein
MSSTNPANIPLPLDPPMIPKHDVHKFRKVTHLMEDNWVQFKFEINAALDERALKEEVEGKESEPNKIKEIEKWNLWHDKDVSAKAQIIQNLSKEVQPIVFDCKSSAEV